MTREEPSARRADAQRIVDVLGDLFDDVAPADRSAAEEELREAGADPTRVGRRMAEHAAGALTGSGARLSEDLRRVPARLPARPGRRSANDPIGDIGHQRRSRGAAIARTAAVLLTGIAIGWLLARGASPMREIAQMSRRSERPNASEPWRGMLGRDLPGRGRSGQQSNADDEDLAAGPSARHGTGGAAAGQGETQTRADSAQGGPATVGTGPDSRSGDAHDSASDVGAEAAAPAEVAEEEGAGEDAPPDEWILERNTWEKGKGLLPAPILERVKTGDYWFTVRSSPPQRFTRNYSRRFWTDSEANAGRYLVDPATCGLLDAVSRRTPSFYAGLPFPEVAADEPTAGCEVMWNVSATGAIDGGRESTLTLDQLTDSASTAARRSALRLSRLAFVGRQSGAIANPDDLRSATLLQATAPSELAGTAMLTLRPNDPAVRDKIWSYVPALRRVRAVSPANRSDGFLGSDLAEDDLECFDGKLEDFTWRVIGAQTVLAPMSTVVPSERTPLSSTRANVPLPRPQAVFESAGARGAPWLVVDNLTLVPRPVWVVEGVPRDRYYLHGKLVLYVDRDLYRTYWRLAYTWQGEYAGHTMCAQYWSRSADGAMASGTAATLTSVNDRLNRATLTRSTSQVIDQGLDRDFFTIAKVIELAH